MVQIPKSMLLAIKDQARAEAPNEACGYLAGQDFSATLRIPMTNVDQSPEHFSFDPKEQFAALKRARSEGIQLFAVYHSHPATPARMSDEDIRLANDPSAIYLIYSMLDDTIKGFTVDRQKQIAEVRVAVAQ